MSASRLAILVLVVGPLTLVVGLPTSEAIGPAQVTTLLTMRTTRIATPAAVLILATAAIRDDRVLRIALSFPIALDNRTAIVFGVTRKEPVR